MFFFPFRTKQGVALGESSSYSSRAMKKRKRNPAAGDHVGYWVAFFALGTLAVTYWAWNSLTPAQQKKVPLPGG